MLLKTSSKCSPCEFPKSVPIGQCMWRGNSHKHVAFLSMAYKLLSVPLHPTNLQREVQTIKYLAYKNSLSLDIDKMIRRKTISRTLDRTTSLPRAKPEEKWSRCPYLGKLSYIGQSGRSFETRMGEHFDAVFNNTPEKSNFAAHIICTQHLLSKCSFRPLHTLDKGKRMTALENLEIIKALTDDIQR